MENHLTVCDWVTRVAFPIQILLIFSFHCNSFLLRYTVENLQVTLFQYAFSVPANKIFQKRTVFVFTES